MLPGAGVLVVLLAGLGLWRLRGRMRRPAGETSFLESRLQPDSFFGASGVGISDRATDELDVLFNTPAGRAYLVERKGLSAVSIRWPKPTSTWPTAATCRPRRS